MLWILSFHVIFVVAWFAGLFYLPRLYVYHAGASDQISIDRFKVMEHKLFYYITTPAGILATLLGFSTMAFHWPVYLDQGWMHAKLGLVLVLWAFHVYCGKLLGDFKSDRNPHSSKFYRWFNEIPTVLLILIVTLVIVNP